MQSKFQYNTGIEFALMYPPERRESVVKRTAGWVCSILFLLLCAAVVWFLHAFTVNEQTMTYIEWQSSVEILEDGSQQPISTDYYTNLPENTGTYRFTAQLPEGLGNGYLLFETVGEELTLSLNGEEIYHSTATMPQGAMGMAQATVYLPENPTGQLTLTCTLLGDQVSMFPPLLRFMPSNLEAVEWMSYANYFGIPVGVAALALLLVAGIFLLSITRNKVEWSLIPLMIAVAMLMTYRIIQSCGYYFLSPEIVEFFAWQGFAWIAPLALLVFLAMNRRRDFWRSLGLVAAWSAGGLLVGYLISLAGGWYLSNYLNSVVSELVEYGSYDSLLYWITLWLAVACAFISAYQVFRSFVRQRAETQTLQLKNKLVLDSYHAIERKMRDSAAMRHEFRHLLTAMDALYQQKEYEQLGALLQKMKQQENGVAQTDFTKNFTVNSILQDAAARSAQGEIAFDAQAHLPAKLEIPDSDLCVLLMNLLDNALEAAALVEKPEDRWIRFKTEIINGFLAVKCQNSYAGTLEENEKGHLSTTKSDPQIHGFGFTQMSAIAEKYCSLLDISYSNEDHVFTAQTALKLPEK